MPTDIPEQTIWILGKITSSLQSAKMWPVKLATIRHQEALSALALNIRAWSSCHFQAIR